MNIDIRQLKQELDSFMLASKLQSLKKFLAEWHYTWISCEQGQWTRQGLDDACVEGRKEEVYLLNLSTFVQYIQTKPEDIPHVAMFCVGMLLEPTHVSDNILKLWTLFLQSKAITNFMSANDKNFLSTLILTLKGCSAKVVIPCVRMMLDTDLFDDHRITKALFRAVLDLCISEKDEQPECQNNM